MEDRLIAKKFNYNPDNLNFRTRKEVLPSGNVITFAIESNFFLIPSEKIINFDDLSDEKIKEFIDSKDDLKFGYIPNFGFDQIFKDE